MYDFTVVKDYYYYYSSSSSSNLAIFLLQDSLCNELTELFQ